MKKFISFLNLSFGLLVSVTAFIACGGDDDENIISSPDSQEAVNSKHITRVDYQGKALECIINYDTKGRVSSFVWKDGKDTNKYIYTYDENSIVEEVGNHISYTFSMLNGRITSAEDYAYSSTSWGESENYVEAEYSFSYDSSGHLQTKKGSKGITYTWENNNLVSYIQTTGSSTKTVNFEYSDIRVSGNYIPYLFCLGRKFKFSENYPFLSYYGFFGKQSQNLPKKMVETQGNTSATEEYDYTMKDGLPIEIAVKKTTISSNGEKSTSNYRIIIEWN